MQGQTSFYDNTPGLVSGALREAGMLSAFTFLHFHGQTLRLCALRRDGRGLFAYRVRKQDGAQWAPSFFLISGREIWRPAVSGTGGIQDDRSAGRQKLVA
jgi:hypothetical protein